MPGLRYLKVSGNRAAAHSSNEVALDEVVRSGVRGKPDLAALASLHVRKLSVLVWHYHDDDVSGPDALVDLPPSHLPGQWLGFILRHRRTTMKACLAAVPCLILITIDPALASPEDTAERVHAARVSEERGDFADAERTLQVALKDAANFVPDDSRKGLILHRLGSVYHSQGRYMEAETYYRKAIQLWKRIPGEDDVPLTHSMRSLAALYLENGQYTKAERLGLDSLLTTLETTRPHSAALAGLTGTLGALAFARARYGEAETYYLRALALWEELAPNGREGLQILIDLGSLFYREARYTKARTCYERALMVAEKLAPRDGPDEVKLLASMGALELKTKGSAEAITFYKKALALGESALGPEHPVVGEVLLSYAVVLRLARQKAEAQTCQKRAEAILRASNRGAGTYIIDAADLRRSPNPGMRH